MNEMRTVITNTAEDLSSAVFGAFTEIILLMLFLAWGLSYFQSVGNTLFIVSYLKTSFIVK